MGKSSDNVELCLVQNKNVLFCKYLAKQNYKQVQLIINYKNYLRADLDEIEYPVLPIRWSSRTMMAAPGTMFDRLRLYQDLVQVTFFVRLERSAGVWV